MLITNIMTATVSEVPGAQGGSYERRPLEFIELCDIIRRISFTGVFGVAQHEYRDGNGLRGTSRSGWTV